MTDDVDSILPLLITVFILIFSFSTFVLSSATVENSAPIILKVFIYLIHPPVNNQCPIPAAIPSHLGMPSAH